jgi:hypothetical protein
MGRQGPEKIKPMNTPTKLIAGVCIALAAAVLLNPSADRHREQIKSGIAERSPLAGLLGLGVLAAFASNYHSVGVGSYTSIQGQTVSVGLLGMVFVIDNRKDF